jgi:hypothetical protein
MTSFPQEHADPQWEMRSPGMEHHHEGELSSGGGQGGFPGAELAGGTWHVAGRGTARLPRRVARGSSAARGRPRTSAAGGETRPARCLALRSPRACPRGFADPASSPWAPAPIMDRQTDRPSLNSILPLAPWVSLDKQLGLSVPQFPRSERKRMSLGGKV